MSPLRVWLTSEPIIDFTDRRQRLAVPPLIRAALDSRGRDDERADRYGSLLTDYEITSSSNAEVAVLPFHAEHMDRRELLGSLQRAERAGLRTLVFAGTDYEPIVDSAAAIVLHPGPTLDRQPKADVLAIPYFFTPPPWVSSTRPSDPKPTIAFCGQGATRRLAGLTQTIRRGALHVRNRITPRMVTPPIRGHVKLRTAALEVLATHPGVETNFVIRNRYRAGVTTTADRSRVEREFWANLEPSAYALCVRGTGNFSARFYEALSLGRIPVLIDTDGILPFEDRIDWGAHLVRLDAENVLNIGDHLVEQHRDHGNDLGRSVEALQGLWRSHLTMHGFFHHLVGSIRALV